MGCGPSSEPATVEPLGNDFMDPPEIKKSDKIIMDEAPPPGVVEQPATPEIKEEDNAEEPPAAEEEKPEENGEEPIEGPPAEEENKEEGEDKAEDAPPSEETPDAEAPAAEE